MTPSSLTLTLTLNDSTCSLERTMGTWLARAFTDKTVSVYRKFTSRAAAIRWLAEVTA